MTVAIQNVSKVLQGIFTNLSIKINDSHDLVVGLKDVWTNPNMHDPLDGGQQVTPLHKATDISYRYIKARADATTPSDWQIQPNHLVYALDYNKLATDANHVKADLGAVLATPQSASGAISATFGFLNNTDGHDTSDRRTVNFIDDRLWWIPGVDTIKVTSSYTTEYNGLSTPISNTSSPWIPYVTGTPAPVAVQETRTGEYTFADKIYLTQYALKLSASSNKAKTWTVYGYNDDPWVNDWVVLDQHYDELFGSGVVRLMVDFTVNIGNGPNYWNIYSNRNVEYQKFKIEVTEWNNDTGHILLDTPELYINGVSKTSGLESFSPILQAPDAYGIVRATGIVLSHHVEKNQSVVIKVDETHFPVATGSITIDNSPMATAGSTIITAKLLNDLDSAIDGVMNTVSSYNGYWDTGSVCQRSCQLSCQVGCQVSCQVCVNSNCHNQNCGCS